MGALQSLKTWWQGIVATDDLEPWNGNRSPEDAREEKIALRKLRADLHAWVTSTFSFLGSEVTDKISRRVRRAARSEDGEMLGAGSAIRDGLLSDFFGGTRTPFVFLFDARYTEDAGRILGKVSSGYGINERFLYNEATQGAVPSRVLEAFKVWLVERSFDLIIFDTGGDEYCDFLVPIAACEEVLGSLHALSIQATNMPSNA